MDHIVGSHFIAQYMSTLNNTENSNIEGREAYDGLKKYCILNSLRRRVRVWGRWRWRRRRACGFSCKTRIQMCMWQIDVLKKSVGFTGITTNVIDQCQYSIHKYCALLPATLEHTSHIGHTLALLLRVLDCRCDICLSYHKPKVVIVLNVILTLT